MLGGTWAVLIDGSIKTGKGVKEEVMSSYYHSLQEMFSVRVLSNRTSISFFPLLSEKK
jgi:hypothetical protein